MKKIVILGGIGNGSVIAAALKDAEINYNQKIEVMGYLNDREPIGSMIEGIPVLGIRTDWAKLPDDTLFINTIYRIEGNEERIENFLKLEMPEDRLYTFIHPSAYVAPGVHQSPGCVVMPLVCISSGASLGKGCLIHVGATIGHNSIVGDFCHLAAQSCIGSFVRIKQGVHIGLNATVREGVILENYSALGMGSVLLENTAPKQIWVGNPARYLKSVE